MSSLAEFSAHIRDPAEVMSLAWPQLDLLDERVASTLEPFAAALASALQLLADDAAMARNFISQIETGDRSMLDGIDDGALNELYAKERAFDVIRHKINDEQTNRIRSVKQKGSHPRVLRMLKRERRSVDEVLLKLIVALRDLRWAIIIAKAAGRSPGGGIEISSGADLKALLASTDAG